MNEDENMDIAWAAGLFEGEGCITMSGGNRADEPRVAKTPRLHLNITDEDVIRKFAVIVGGMVTGPHQVAGHPEWKPIYSWYLNGVKPVQIVLRRMWPYLCERRRARAALLIAQYYEAPAKRRRSQADIATGITPPNLEDSSQRSRARREGHDIPKRKPGPKPRQSSQSC